MTAQTPSTRRRYVPSGAVNWLRFAPLAAAWIAAAVGVAYVLFWLFNHGGYIIGLVPGLGSASAATLAAENPPLLRP